MTEPVDTLVNEILNSTQGKQPLPLPAHLESRLQAIPLKANGAKMYVSKRIIYWVAASVAILFVANFMALKQMKLTTKKETGLQVLLQEYGLDYSNELTVNY